MVASNSLYFDTNAILRYLLRDNEGHYLTVKKKLGEAKRVGGVVIALGEVVAECVYVMEKIYKIPRLDIGKSLIDFLKTSMVFCDEKDVLLSAFTEYQTMNLAYVDILLLKKFKKHGGKLVTFDKKLLAKSK